MNARVSTILVVLALVCAVVSNTRAQESAPLKETSVGISARLEGVVLAGTELEPKSLTDRKPVLVLRVVQVYPHGTSFRYDFEYYGLEPGTYDLRDFLKRKDNTPVTNLAPLLVKVNPVRPPGQVRPNQLEIEKGPQIGGYRLMVIGLSTLWVLGLVAILAWIAAPYFRSKASQTAAVATVSLADRLRPLVEGAIAGKLSQPELANLERALLAYWRKKLGLESHDPAEVMENLRNHAEAGPLLNQLEEWLHKPGPSKSVDVGQLLEPYRALPPETLELNNP